MDALIHPGRDTRHPSRPVCRTGRLLLFCRARRWTFGLAILGIACSTLPALVEGTELRPDAWAHGEIWRLWSSHWTHYGASHAFWDLLLWVFLGSWIEPYGGSRPLKLAAGIVAPALSLAFLLLHPELNAYRGLSGLDSFLYGWLCLAWIRAPQARRRLGAGLALGGFVAKCLYEGLTQSCVFAEPDTAFVPLPWIHLLALALGIITQAKAVLFRGAA